MLIRSLPFPRSTPYVHWKSSRLVTHRPITRAILTARMNQGNTVDILQLLSASIDLAQQAGSIIRSVQQIGHLGTIQKGFDDPCTVADLRSQELIISGLLSLVPSLSIVGEENLPQNAGGVLSRTDLLHPDQCPAELRSVPVSDVTVFVDPLDATKEFTTGNLECVMTLIGISIKGVPVAGVMHQPFVNNVLMHQYQGKTVWGICGGAVGGLELPRRKARNGLVLAVTASHISAATERAIQLIRPDEVVHAGGAGYKTLLILEGKADVWVLLGRGTSKWDTCGPEAILRCLGGNLTDTTGAAYEYVKSSETANLRGVVASIGDHAEFIRRLNS